MEDVLEADTEAVEDAAANLKLFSTFGGAKQDDGIFIVFIDKRFINIFAQAEPAEEKDEELDDIGELI